MELATIALVAWERSLSMLEASAVPFVTDLKLSPSFIQIKCGSSMVPSPERTIRATASRFSPSSSPDQAGELCDGL